MRDVQVERPVAVGQQVPAFEMEVYDPRTGKFGKFSFEEAKRQGKWVVLFFYPADFTFVCPTELADLNQYYDQLQQSGVEVVSVSTDTVYVHLAWTQAEPLLKDFKIPMGADPTGTVSRLFGVYDPDSGLALRGSFVINPDGTLVASEVNYYNVGRNADELYRKIQACLYLKDHPEEACPAKWQPGEQTLKPSEELVGHVGDVLRRN